LFFGCRRERVVLERGARVLFELWGLSLERVGPCPKSSPLRMRKSWERKQPFIGKPFRDAICTRCGTHTKYYKRW